MVVGGVLIGAGTALIADMLLEKSTGKGIGEHWIDACERLSNGRLQKMRAMSLPLETAKVALTVIFRCE